MATQSPALALAIMSALTASAHSQSHIQPSTPSQAERLSPQFLFGWSAQEQEVATKALHALEGQGGIDDYLMARQARILRKFEQGYAFYDQNWTRLQPFVLQDAVGNPWTILQMTLPEVILTGFAVSRNRYCRSEDQDMGEDLAATYCAEMNRRSIELFGRIEKSRHMLPGGARHVD